MKLIILYHHWACRGVLPGPQDVAASAIAYYSVFVVRLYSVPPSLNLPSHQLIFGMLCIGSHQWLTQSKLNDEATRDVWHVSITRVHLLISKSVILARVLINFFLRRTELRWALILSHCPFLNELWCSCYYQCLDPSNSVPILRFMHINLVCWYCDKVMLTELLFW